MLGVTEPEALNAHLLRIWMTHRIALSTLGYICFHKTLSGSYWCSKASRAMVKPRRNGILCSKTTQVKMVIAILYNNWAQTLSIWSFKRISHKWKKMQCKRLSVRTYSLFTLIRFQRFRSLKIRLFIWLPAIKRKAIWMSRCPIYLTPNEIESWTPLENCTGIICSHALGTDQVLHQLRRKMQSRENTSQRWSKSWKA